MLFNYSVLIIFNFCVLLIGASPLAKADDKKCGYEVKSRKTLFGAFLYLFIF